MYNDNKENSSCELLSLSTSVFNFLLDFSYDDDDDDCEYIIERQRKEKKKKAQMELFKELSGYV